jgi:phospholipid transport system substrate-binding protein
VSKGGVETPVDYRLHRAGDRWLAYDVNIEGVSLVANYRAQFNAIVRASSTQALVTRLRAR